MNPLVIRKAWRSYKEKVIPRNAPAVQVEESRRAFYAGAHTLFSSILQGLSGGSPAKRHPLA